MEEARKLAQFVKQITYSDLPADVVGRAKELILDQLGCQIAGSILPWGKAIYRYIRDNDSHRQESMVVNYGLKTVVQDAAFANANFGHGFVADDTDPVSKSHLGAIIIPAALAIGEREMISGKEFIKAVVVGYDVALRIGAAAKLAIKRGFHPGPIFGPFGVAACTGLILGLDEGGILNAIGIAGSHSSGLMEYSDSGSSVNRLHAGIAAFGGIRAAFLAQRGFSGPPTILEGKRGVCRAFSDEQFLSEIGNGLGKEFGILRVMLKPYCCDGVAHASLDAVSKITDKHSITPKEVEEIIVSAPDFVLGFTSTIAEPREISSAQLSGRFGIALRLVKGGNGFKEYTEENLKDPEVLSLMPKIKYELDSELDKLVGAYNPTKVAIRLLDGTVYGETVIAARGSIQNPMTKEEIYCKFKDLALMVFSDSQVEKIVESVSALEEINNASELARLLVCEKGEHT